MHEVRARVRDVAVARTDLTVATQSEGSMCVTTDPARLAEKVAVAIDRLAACLATDVRIEPVDVLLPLIQTARSLYDVSDEISRAAVGVDQPAAAASRRAAHHFLSASTELGVTVARLSVQPPRSAERDGRRGP